jgi:hypothetical protein
MLYSMVLELSPFGSDAEIDATNVLQRTDVITV